MENINSADVSKTRGLIEICTPRGSGEKQSPATSKRKTFRSQCPGSDCCIPAKHVGKTEMVWK